MVATTLGEMDAMVEGIMSQDTSFFYKRKVWQNTRDAYLSSVGYLCEDCMERGIYEPAVIVHHKIHLNSQTVNNPDIALNWKNLKAVCRKCHAEEHGDYYQSKSKSQKRYSVDENGVVVLG